MYFRDSRNVYVIVNNVLFADIQNLGIAYQFLDRNPDYNAAVDYIVPNPDQDGEAIDGKVLVVFKDGTQVDKVKYSNIESVLSGKISSAPISTQGPGGIDFRVLPITTQPAGMTVIQGKMIAGKAVAGIIANDRLDGEWKDIEDMLNGDIMPSVERIKEYLSLSCKTKDCQARINQVLNGVAEMFRLEEERSSRTDAALKQLLVLLESERPANELESGLAKINVAPGEVQAIEK
jgi:hypothetical protein